MHTESGRKLVGDLKLDIPDVEQRHEQQAIFFDHLSRHGTPLRVVAQRLQPASGDEAVWVIVAESKEKRRQVKDEIATAIFLPALLAGFLIIPLFYYSIRRALSPARQLSALVVAHGDDNLAPARGAGAAGAARTRGPHQLLAAAAAGLGHRATPFYRRCRPSAADAHGRHTPAGRRHAAHTEGRPAAAHGRRSAGPARRGRHPRRMVKQLLAYARVADSATEPERFDAVEAVLEPAPRWRSHAEAAGKTLTVQNHVDPHQEFFLQGSPILLGEVISNLLDNAIRYGGTHIALLLHHHENSLIVQVQDDGPALDAQSRENLLLPFWRGSHGKPEGSGLGLSIAQRIVERLGGRFALVNRPGLGACFEITLPCEVQRLEIDATSGDGDGLQADVKLAGLMFGCIGADCVCKTGTPPQAA